MAWHEARSPSPASVKDVESGSEGSPAAAPAAAAGVGGDGGGKAGARGSDAAFEQPQPEPHWWELEVFPEHPMPEFCRDTLSYRGLRANALEPHTQQPLLLAAVHGSDAVGRPFTWLARRQRKRVLHPHQCASPPPRVAWLAALDARRQARKVGWWVALLFTAGSLMFVISGIAGVIGPSGNPAHRPPGLASLNAGLIGWPNALAANLLFFPAGLLQLVEVVRMGQACQLKAWEARGRRGPRPRARLLPGAADLRCVSLWAAAVQLSGMLGFNMATLASLAACARELAPGVADWTVRFGFTFGGAAFTVSGALYCWEATGSWWRGLVPSRAADLRSISWHAAFWGFHGSVGFLISGAGTYAASFSWEQSRWMAGVGSLGGALWFELSALAALLEQANPGHP